MKFNNIIDKITRIAAVIAFTTTAICSCDKPFEIEQPLGVTSKIVNLKASAGETPVVVYAAAEWTAHLTEKVDWASIDRMNGNGMSQIKFAYSQNFGAARKVGIVFESSKEIPDTVMMIQASGNEKPDFQFTDGEDTAPKLRASLNLGFRTDMIYNIDEITTAIDYEPEEQSGWITDFVISTDGVSCTLAENTSGAERTAIITLSHKDAKDAVIRTFMRLTQSADAPTMVSDLSSIGDGIESIEQAIEIPIGGNMSALYNQMKCEVEYEGSQTDWISGIVLDDEKLFFSVTPNPEKEVRKANIICSYKSADGQEYCFEIPVNQKKYTTVYTIEDLKALITGETGEVIISSLQGNDGNLNAIVIGDKDNENMEINPNIQPRKIDWNGNPVTNYLQNEDGTSGIRIKCATAADNVFQRYSKVTLDLEGMKLIKEANPTRYTLENVRAANVLSNEKGQSENVPYKEKTIAQLTDEDVYTYTTLKNLEMTFKQGDYTNVHDGYAIKIGSAGTTVPFFDAAPASLRDADGSSIYMIFNMKTPWRRAGKGVFQGTANVSGIIVSTKLIRYAKDGNLGKYSLRVLEREDIAETGIRFSKTIVEWDWKGQTTDLLKPTTGNGQFSFSMEDGTKLTTHIDFNTLGRSGSGIPNGAIVFERPYWWDDTNDAAPYFLVEFSTRGISGKNLVFNWAIGQGNAGGASITAPAYWHIEYSTDGKNFTKLAKDYAVRPLVWWNNSLSLSAIPGFHNYTTPLPSSLFGQEKVYLKIIASGKAAATANADQEQNTNSKPNNRIRFDEMAVEYN